MLRIQTMTTHLNNTQPYATCPIELMAMKKLNGVKLTANAKLAYMIMANDFMFYVRERGFYQPFNKHLAEKTGMAESTLRTALEVLEAAGLIEVVEAKEGFCKKYKVLSLVEAKKSPEKPQEAPQEALKQEVVVTPQVEVIPVREPYRAPQAPRTWTSQEYNISEMFQDDSDRPF